MEAVEPYAFELSKIKIAFERINKQFGNTPMTSTNQRLLESAVANEFGEIGFTAEIDWYQVGKDDQLTDTYIPRIVLTGRTTKQDGIDHDRVAHEVVTGMVDGVKGYIREDGSKREDPIKKLIV